MLIANIICPMLVSVSKLFSAHFTLFLEFKFSKRLKQEETFLFSPFLIFLIVSFGALTRRVGFLSPWSEAELYSAFQLFPLSPVRNELLKCYPHAMEVAFLASTVELAFKSPHTLSHLIPHWEGLQGSPRLGSQLLLTVDCGTGPFSVGDCPVHFKLLAVPLYSAH